MKLKSIIQGSLFTALLATSLSQFAFADNELIRCPSMELIKQSWEKLDTVSIMNTNIFAVWGINTIKASNYSWYITTYANAQDLNSALEVGRNNVKNVNGMRIYALDMRDAYYCDYMSSTSSKVSAIAFKNENVNLTHLFTK